jgi:hypothetical protein
MSFEKNTVLRRRNTWVALGGATLFALAAAVAATRSDTTAASRVAGACASRADRVPDVLERFVGSNPRRRDSRPLVAARRLAVYRQLLIDVGVINPR